MGIGVYIELGGIHTLTSPDSVVDLYATFNQAESQNKSDNIKFGLRQRMKSGKAMLNHSQFLGYTKGSDGVLRVVPEEAEIVQKILYVERSKNSKPVAAQGFYKSERTHAAAPPFQTANACAGLQFEETGNRK